MKKSVCIGIIAFFILVIFVIGVFAQVDSTGVKEGVDELRDKYEDVKKTKEQIEEEKLDFLGNKWREFLKGNEFIAKFDSFLKKSNIVFVVFFARNYEMSVEMFFVLVLWSITFISLIKYMVWFKEGWQKFALALGSVVILSHIQLFNIVSRGMFKLMFYKKGALWVFLSIVIIIVIVMLYYYINKLIAKSLEDSKKAREKAELEMKVKKIEEREKSIVKASG